MTVAKTVSNQQLFALEDQRLKAEQRASMCTLFAERVKELRELHNKIIENKNDWTDFYDRIKDEDPEAPSDWEESEDEWDEWASSSC